MTQETNVVTEAGLEGRRFEPADELELADAVDHAFDYRGDVTLALSDGRTVEGYLFDRRRDAGELRVMLPDGVREVVAYSAVKSIALTGRDPATGRSWETWVKKYIEKKKAGVSASMFGPGEERRDA
ncbi:MAG: hypothetical protein RIG82_03585 [Phycisphaeraceae bacterium]